MVRRKVPKRSDWERERAFRDYRYVALLAANLMSADAREWHLYLRSIRRIVRRDDPDVLKRWCRFEEDVSHRSRAHAP